MIESFSKLLSFPAAYRLFSRVVSGNVWEVYMAEYVRPAPGEKLLDIGCGPGDVLYHLPRLNYTGVDISPEYIEAAKRRFGERGRFLCSDVALVTLEREYGTFDLAIATGVLHHLDNERAAKLLELARLALKPGGRFISYDGCYVPEQSKIARYLLSKDRGQFVRRRDEYLRLAAASFTHVEPHLRHDLLRIPYTHLIMRCSN